MKISLCIPTNGIVEWISQVIESIYSQNVSLDLFEVVIVDNGDNPVFFDYINEKINEYPNIRYKKIKCPIFMNEIEAYKMAKGDFIKFVNHRTVLLGGTLNKWISFMEENYETKPVVYFSNGVLNKYYSNYNYESFNDFIGALSYWSSWSTGMAMWKEDVDDLDMDNINELFPHTSILFKNRHASRYIVDNRIYLQEVPHTSKNKGKYDLFYAFAVEFPSLLLNLYRDGDICIDTFLKLKGENLDFINEIYRTFCVENAECSYDLGGYEDCIRVFYNQEMLSVRNETKRNIFQTELNKRLDSANKHLCMKAVYGAGMVGREFVMENGNGDIICFIDRSENKQGSLLLGIPVVSYEKFIEMNINAEIVVCVNKEKFHSEEEKLLLDGKRYSYWRLD